ncbi:DoxX family protein [Spiractinospora alimapuensis]|uniref:DoxX family protein n=1 Tax=Spiractinospora alimapuensis TaxID=2820884 RepID=UPI002ED4AB91
MSAYVILTLVAAAMVGFSAGALYLNASVVTAGLVRYGVPRSWWPWLATAKALGAVGLLVGLAVPAVGVAAGIGLVLYFTGAVATIVRARVFTHVPVPLFYAAPVVAALALGVTAT